MAAPHEPSGGMDLLPFQTGDFQRFHPPPANAFRTSDWEIPNWRAMRDGVIPALKAARTAFQLSLR